MPDLAEAEAEKTNLSQHVRSVTGEHMTYVVTGVDPSMIPGARGVIFQQCPVLYCQAEIMFLFQAMNTHELSMQTSRKLGRLSNRSRPAGVARKAERLRSKVLPSVASRKRIA